MHAKAVFYARPAAVQPLTAANTWYKLSYSLEDADSLGNYDASNGVFTAPATGIYCITGAMLFSSSIDGDEIKLSIGSDSGPSTVLSHIRPGTSGFVTTNGSLTVSLAAGKKIALWAVSTRANFATSPDGNYYHFTITRVA
jgi:hypothetical protein